MGAEQMSRKGENIYRRKDGRWEGRYIRGRKQDGKAVYGYVYAKTYYDVKRKLTMAIVDLEYKEKEKKEINVTVYDFALSWLSDIKIQVKQSTYMRYKNIINNYLFVEFHGIMMKNLTAECLRNHCNHLLESGGVRKKGLSPKTVADILSLIRNILKYAQENGWQTACSGKEVVIKQIPKEMCVLHLTEQKILCEYLSDHISERNIGILLCLFIGLRIGEICALKWEDISLTEKTIHVHHTIQRIQIEGNSNKKTKVIITTPKSKCSIRTIPIPDNIINILNKISPNQCGFLLTGTEKKYVEPRTMQNHLKKVLESASLRSVNFHALRHTFATRCVEVGFDIKSLSEILGHANVNITMNRYVHPTMDLKRDNMQKLSTLFAVK